MRVDLEIDGFQPEEIRRYQEILLILIKSGGLSGVKGGKTILHFDAEGIFQGVELDYWPWRRKKRFD